MLTRRAAASLLAACDDAASLRELLGLLGFSGAPMPIGSGLRESLQLEGACTSAEIISGAGALRACAVVVPTGAAARETVATLARRLASRAPHVLWLVAGVQAAPPCVVIAVAPAEPSVRLPMLAVDRVAVADSDAETFVALVGAAPRGDIDLAVHARWIELLGREALNRRFYRVLERRVHALAESATGGRSLGERSELALLCSSRLLFLAFLQARGWLDGDGVFLSRAFDSCMAGGGAFHRRTLRPLFFGTLNTPRCHRAATARRFGRIPFLNGGLFAPAPSERGPRAAVLSDDALGAFLDDVIGHYRFTAREDRTAWTDATVDPEMLGRAFESLMAAPARRSSGTFYTPSAFVSRVADGCIAAALERLLPAEMSSAVQSLAAGRSPEPEVQAEVRTAIAAMTLLDPACGSGAFLVHALERLAGWSVLTGDHRSPDAIRRALLCGTIFGIDRDPTAVWLCELRLWLAVVVECTETDPVRVLPLPNLDRNIRVGDALGPMGLPGAGTAHATVRREAAHLAQLRTRYARASGARKQSASRTLDRAERQAAIAGIDAALGQVTHRRRDITAARRSRDLFGDRAANASLDREAATLRARAAELRAERRRTTAGGALPFRYEVHFSDVMVNGGFAAVVGNPPWVRLHRIPAAERVAMRDRFTVLRDAAWMPGAAAGGAGAGFAGQADLAALFVERSLALLRPTGVLALLVPAKLWTSLAGGGVRRMLATDAQLLALEDCTEAPELFDAVTYPSILVAARASRETGSHEAHMAVHHGGHVARWTSKLAEFAWDASGGSPWLVVPPAVRRAFDRVRSAGVPLWEQGFGRPQMGVKCGHNDAFLVVPDVIPVPSPAAEEVVQVRDRCGRTGLVEASLLRPVIRGEHVRAWRAASGGEQIVWTHGAAGVLRVLPPHAARWLAPHRSRLVARSDSRGTHPWWILHRIEGAQSGHPRVVWSDLSRVPRAIFLPAGDPAVPLNTCYVLRCPRADDAQALSALLNTPLAAAWLRTLAEPARGGYRRLFAWTMALFPLPADWPRARGILAPITASASRATAGGGVPSSEDLLEAALDAYGLRRDDVAPLLEWHARSIS